jgi:hypothetical protein
MQNVIIGLSGLRQVGKSHIARHLVEQHGFTRLHPFDGGKAASRAYFMHLGIDAETAARMTDGDLKDKPCDVLPVISNVDHGRVGTHYTSRFWMEKFGQFMGSQLGPEWTIEREIDRHLRSGQPFRLVAESIVYEAETLRRMGGIILRVEREVDRSLGISGLETDKFGADIVPDHVLKNDGETLAELYAQVDDFLRDAIGLRQDEAELCPA